MTAKERVKRAVAHRGVDRAPTGLFGTSSDYETGLARFIGVDSVAQMYRKLGVDIWHSRVKLKCGNDAENPWGITKENPRPFARLAGVGDIEAYPVADPRDFDTSELVEHLRDYQEFAVCGGINSAVFHNYLGLCGQENALCLLKTEPELAQAMIERITNFWELYLRKVLQAADGLIDMIENCNDFGTQRSMFISPDDFRLFFRKPLSRLYNAAKEHGVLYMQHSCGSIEPLIDDFIGMGADILNPIQVEADGMDIEQLVAKYRGRITFYGGIDTQQLLPKGPEAEIRCAVRRINGLFGRDGGLIVSGSQGLLEDIPYPHAVAMLEENKRCANT